MKRLVPAPDVTGLDVGNNRISARIALTVERVGAEQRVDIRSADDRTFDIPRNSATYIPCWRLEAGVGIERDDRRRFCGGIELDGRSFYANDRSERKCKADGNRQAWWLVGHI